MFRFESPEYFYFLIILLVLIGLLYFWLLQKTKRMLLWNPLIAKTQNKVSFKDVFSLKNNLFFAGMLFSIIALTNPQWGEKKEEKKVERTDIYIALDISNSMNVTDIAPSRLEKAKKFVSDLILAQKNNRIGIIFFAGNAYLQMPLTLDYASALMYVKTVQTDMAPTQGSDIGQAIELSQKFNDVETEGQKALIIVSDGEDHEKEAVTAAKEAAENGTIVFTVAVGTENGGIIPILSDEGEDVARDDDGEPAISKVDFQFLKSLAKAGKGKSYILTSPQNVIKDIGLQLENVKKQWAEMVSYSAFNSHFMIFIILAMISFTGMFWLPFITKNKGLFVVLFVFFVQGLSGQSAHQLLRNGDNLYGSNRFLDASKQYEEAAKLSPNFKSFYNLGNAYYQQQKYKEAQKAYEKAVEQDADNQKLSDVWHNLGNTRFLSQEYDKSVEAYKKSLQYRPNDKETIENLLKARKLLQKQQQEQQKNQQDQQKKDNQNQDQKKQQQQEQNQKDQDEKNKDQNPSEQEKKKPQNQNRNQQLTPEEAEKLMEIIENEDKKVNQKVRRGSEDRKIPKKPW
jgi:tetratricopeptide (TPR) repeat protein